MGQTSPPATVAQFKAQFGPRDFVYSSGTDGVMDSDIQKGLNMASSVFNPSLFDTSPVGSAPNITSEALICYLNAAAHFMVLNIQAVGGLGVMGQGVFSQGEGMITSKAAGGLNIMQSWPTVITDSPVLYALTKTAYGAQYLQVLMTRLVGNVGAVGGECADGPNP
jgi:hypothetical protein